QGSLGRRAETLAGLLVVGEASRHGGERNRKIEAVATAHADGAVGTGLRADIARGSAGIDARIVVAEQPVQKIALAADRVGVLRPAIVLRQRQQNRAALIVAVGVAEAAAAQPLEVAGNLIEVRPHLLDLVVDRTALRRLAVEQREKSGTVA